MVRLGRFVAAMAVTFVLGMTCAGADQLSRTRRENHRSDRPGRQLRPGRPRAGRRAVEAHGAILLCGEQARRRHGRGNAGRRTERSGRLHAGRRRPLQHGVQFRALFNLGYDPLRDFVPVAMVYRFGYIMVGRKDLPQASGKEIVAVAKDKPGSITVATAGAGTGQQLVAAAFMKAAGVKLQEVPYKGSPPAFTDLLAGRIDLFFDSIAAGLPYVQSGQARGIAVLASKRSALVPMFPHSSEAGVSGLMSIPGSASSCRQKRRLPRSRNCATISAPCCRS